MTYFIIFFYQQTESSRFRDSDKNLLTQALVWKCLSFPRSKSQKGKMKVRIYADIVLYGPTPEEGKVHEIIWIDSSLPALPRQGEIMDLCGTQNFIGEAIVSEVRWFPDKEKINVFFPVIHLEEDDYFNRNCTSGVTISRKLKVLKNLVRKTHDNRSNCLRFECNE